MKPIIQEAVDNKTRPVLRIRRSFGYTLFESLALVLAIYTLLNLTTVRFVVDGLSMFPTFESGQYLVVNRMSYIFGRPQRGDVIVFHLPSDPSRDFIKRVIALPRETIEFRATEVYINGVLFDEAYINEACDISMCGDGFWQLGDDEYFVMGDNRNQSSDSRFLGAIGIEYIVGEVMLRYYPFSEFEYLQADWIR